MHRAADKSRYFRDTKFTDEKAQSHYSEGTIEINDIPDGYKLTENKKSVVDCIKDNAPIFNKIVLTDILSKITWPCYYLDFETAKTAIPFWENVAPRTKDSRRELTDHMLERLGGREALLCIQRLTNPNFKSRKEIS